MDIVLVANFLFTCDNFAKSQLNRTELIQWKKRFETNDWALKAAHSNKAPFFTKKLLLLHSCLDYL